MNKLNKIVLALFVGLFASVTAVAQVTTFQEGNLYYKITDTVNHKVSVVPENATSPYYTTSPSGDIVIPTTVAHNSVNYTVESIADHAFDGCTGITSIKLSATTPYVVNANVFEGVTLSGIKLIVPQAAKAAYKAAAVWSDFKVVGDGQHVITITPAVNGTLTVTNAGVNVPTGTPVDDETVLTVNATANPDYQVDSIKVGNVKVANNGTFTVTEAVTVEAFISQIPAVTKFKVSYDANMEGGVIKVVSGSDVIASGDSVAQGTIINISVSTNPGYTVKSLKVNGVDVSTNGYSHTVNADVLIEAEFPSMTDIENVSATATKVYPNPVVDILNVETQEDVIYIRVYNMYGVEVARIANANAIDLASLAAGNYLVRVQTATGVSTHRIVKK